MLVCVTCVVDILFVLGFQKADHMRRSLDSLANRRSQLVHTSTAERGLIGSPGKSKKVLDKKRASMASGTPRASHTKLARASSHLTAASPALMRADESSTEAAALLTDSLVMDDVTARVPSDVLPRAVVGMASPHGTSNDFEAIDVSVGHPEGGSDLGASRPGSREGILGSPTGQDSQLPPSAYGSGNKNTTARAMLGTSADTSAQRSARKYALSCWCAELILIARVVLQT